MQRTVEYAEIGYDSSERIEYRVEDKRLQRAFVIALGCRHTLDDRFEHLLDALSGLARGEQNFLLLATYKVDDLILYLVYHRRVAVDLVEHGDDLQILPQGKIEIRYGLSLYALRRVDHQQRTLARGYRARHLVGEVDMSRSVDQIEDVCLRVARGIFHLYGVALYGNTLFALQIHVVEHRIMHLALVERIRLFQQSVGQRTLAVVDMGDNTEIAYVFHRTVQFFRLQK